MKNDAASMMSPKPWRVRVRHQRYQLIDPTHEPPGEVNDFLAAQHVRGLSQRTVRAYAFDLLVLCRWLHHRHKTLRALTHADLVDFVAAQRLDKASPRTMNRRLSTCLQLCRFLSIADLDVVTGSDPPGPPQAPQLPIPSLAPLFGPRAKVPLDAYRRRSTPWKRLNTKVPRTLVEPLTKAQVLGFLGTLHRYRDLAIVYLMLLCGLRSKEVLHLRLQDVSWLDNRLRVFGKGQKERLLPLSENLGKVIGDYLCYERPARCSSRALFVVLQGKRRGRPMTLGGLRSLFRHRRIKEPLSIANPHRFRHTFGSNMARAGVRLPVLQKLMGHAFCQTTMQYINLSLEDVEAEYQRAIDQIRKRYDL